MRNFVIGCLLFLSIATRANAGWNGVEWGMTEAQVRKEYPPAIEKVSGQTYYLSIDGSVIIGDNEFHSISFYFNTKGQLKAVSTKLRVPFDQVSKKMAGQFGAPVLSDNGDLMGLQTKRATFRDTTKRNLIEIYAFENPKNTIRETMITYSEIDADF